MQDDDGNYIEDQMVDFGEFEKKGVKVECSDTHNEGSKSCEHHYYIFGQYFNKGGWYTTENIKTGPDGFNLRR